LEGFIEKMKEYLDLLERCGATFVQAAVATISGNSFLEMGVSNWKLVVASGFAAVLSVLKGWAATKVGDSSFSLVGRKTQPEEILYGEE
tara:strand:+ start:33 stop:299 length:267 start_codon:yes stop_codon:yes gene_type:complete